jgi:ABC-type nitrate/sulfonate/bicarbonate transport system ATPase subunit
LYGTGRLQYLHQRPTLWDHLSVSGNIELAARLTESGDQATLAKLTDDLGLVGSEHKYPYELSEGMKARVALARVFVSKPAVVLADEPFASLDYRRRELLNIKLSLLAALSKSTVLMVTHDVVESLRFSSVAWVVQPSTTRLIEIALPGSGEALDPNAIPAPYLSLRDRILAAMEERLHG